MGRIVAVGAADLNTPINDYIVSLCGKTAPKALFLPTASHDAEEYIRSFKTAYEALGCMVDTACLCAKSVNMNLVRSKIFSADIIYIGGGDTAFMMSLFRRYKIDEMLGTAFERGILLAGHSAGAISFFKAGYSDSVKALGLVRGVGIIPYVFCPHYNERRSFDSAVSERPAVALEDGTAAVYDGTGIEFVRWNADSAAFIFNGEVKEEITKWNTL